MIAFTITSRNYLGYALTLFDSYSRAHPDTPFYVVLADSADGLDLNSFPFELLAVGDLQLPDLAGMAERYNITEFNTALKPFAFLELFDRHPGEPVLYLDPDIYVVSRFEELDRLVADGIDCILTPHRTEPQEFGEFTDIAQLQYGVNNLGMCMLRDTDEVRRVTWWWARRLEHDCRIDLERGIFVDQKWADLLPAFIERTRLLRHPGYNVAYWNLTQRRVAHGEAGWTVNGQPLRFAHFSGNVIEDDTVFSRHSSQFHLRNIGQLADLMSEYRERVLGNGHLYYLTLPYEFGWDGSSGTNLHTPAELLSRRGAKDALVPHLPVERYRDASEYAARHRSSRVRESRSAIETASIPGEASFRLGGICAVCEAVSEFRVGPMYSPGKLSDGRTIPNWREHLDCVKCGLVTRIRGGYQVWKQEFRPAADAQIYLTERITRTYEALTARFPNTIGSEYLGPACEPGSIVDGIRHEDVQKLSFADESFDFVLTFDVLEHVPHHERALAEFWRVLRPGGGLLITVPFRVESQLTETRALLSADGEVEHIMAPEYHGNPVDNEAGSLAYRTFGWQLLDDLRQAGFEEARAVLFWSEQLRYLGDPEVAVVGVKPSAS